MNVRYRRGWFGESHRHYLAAKGIKTKRTFKYFDKLPVDSPPDDFSEQVKQADIEKEILGSLDSERGGEMILMESLLPASRFDYGSRAETVTYGEMISRGNMGEINPEGKSFREIFPKGEEEDVKATVTTFDKPTYFSGNFGDLFKGGEENNLRIINRHGDVVRTLKKHDDGTIELDAMTGNPDDIIIVNALDDLLYEPWTFDDNGSILFIPVNPPIGVPKGKPLKLSTEQDRVEFF